MGNLTGGILFVIGVFTGRGILTAAGGTLLAVNTYTAVKKALK